MRNYRVEEMDGNAIQKTHAIKASTPFDAAAKVINRQVTFRKNGEAVWVRVTDSHRGLVFEYCAAEESAN